MKYIFSTYLCFIGTFLNAQTVYNQFDWGTTSILGNNNTTLLSNSDFLLCADSYAGVNGDKTTVNFGVNDLWVTKLNMSNQVIWQKSFGGNDDDNTGIIRELSNGDLLITCRSKSPISGNKSVNTNGGFDYWVLRIDATGNIIWQKSFGTSGAESPTDVLIISDTLFCIIGSTSFQGIDGDKTENSYGSSDFWIILIDENGNKIWDKTIGGSSGETSRKGLWDSLNQRILVTGSSMSGIGGLKTEVNYGLDDFWVFSLDINGNIIEQKTIGGSGFDSPKGICINNQGELFVYGNSNSDVSGNKTQVNYGGYDGWLVKLDSNLNILEDLVFGGLVNENLNSLSILENNHIVLSCSSYSDLSGNRISPLKGIYDCWFVGLNPNTLQIEWQTSFGGSLGDSPINLWETTDSYKVIATSGSPISIDKTVTSWGDYDFWVFEFDKIAGLEEHQLQPIKVFPNPAHEQISFELLSDELMSEPFEISDIQGKKQFSSVINSPNFSISTSHFPSGIYFYEIAHSSGKVYRGKFVKE